MKTLAFVQSNNVIAVNDYDDNVNPSQNLIDVTNMSPQPEAGWTYDGTNFKGIRRIHKAFFINRLNPWWDDIKAARAADSTIDNYFEQFGHFTHVDLDWTVTIAMVADLKAAVLAVNPSSDFDETLILQDGTIAEKY